MALEDWVDDCSIFVSWKEQSSNMPRKKKKREEKIRPKVRKKKRTKQKEALFMARSGRQPCVDYWGIHVGGLTVLR